VKLAELGEFGLIGRIEARFPQLAPPELGIGDDAAIISPSAGMQLVVSTDLLAEGVHFDSSYGSAYLLGRKALAVNLSDLAAMGATPRWFFLSLAIPAGFPLEEIETMLDGMAELAGEHRCILAGGDTCSSKSGLVLSVTVMGEQRPDLLVKRSGARQGDDVWVTGTLGDSALGLKILQERTVHPDAAAVQHLLARHLDPVPRVQFGSGLGSAGLATAMIDISDGLLADLGHICRQSGCGAVLQLASIPRSTMFNTLTASDSKVPWHLAVAGGEDYELCFTADPARRPAILELAKKSGIPATIVGIVTNSGQVQAMLPDGSELTPSHSGYKHF
jgi:thiamine-monophosphate kinase